MTIKDVFAELKALGDEKIWVQNVKNGAGDNQFGVRLGEIRKVAKKVKTNHEMVRQQG